MWVIQFNVLRDSERSPEDGSPREFLGQDSPFPLPDIDQTVLHRGEAFVVDDVIWDLERKTVTVELVPPDEADAGGPKPVARAAADGNEGSDAGGGDDGAEDFDENLEDFGDSGADGGDGAEDFGEDLDPQSGERTRPGLRGDNASDAPEAPPAGEGLSRKDTGRSRRPARGSGPSGTGEATRRGGARPE